MNLIGDVKGKVAVLVDDMIDTAGKSKHFLVFHSEYYDAIISCSFDFQNKSIIMSCTLMLTTYCKYIAYSRHYNKCGRTIERKGSQGGLCLLHPCCF
jgi:hypothetical protein